MPRPDHLVVHIGKIRRHLPDMPACQRQESSAEQDHDTRGTDDARLGVYTASDAVTEGPDIVAWIESHQELRMSPKVRRMVRALDIPLPQAIGHLHLLWWWCIDYAPTGRLDGYELGDIADAAEWHGCASDFVEALVAARLLDRSETGELEVHDWWDYAGQLIATREADRERKRDLRRKSAGRPPDVRQPSGVPDPTGPVTGPNRSRPTKAPSKGAPTTRRDRSRTTPDYRTSRRYGAIDAYTKEITASEDHENSRTSTDDPATT